MKGSSSIDLCGSDKSEADGRTPHFPIDYAGEVLSFDKVSTKWVSSSPISKSIHFCLGPRECLNSFVARMGPREGETEGQ